MGHFPNTLFPSIPSFIEALQEEKMHVPEHLLQAVMHLKQHVTKALEADEMQLQTSFEALFPELWQLRIAALPFLAQVEITDALHKVELDLEAVTDRVPQLKSTVERLRFGFDLMTPLVQEWVTRDHDLLENVALANTPDYYEVLAEYSTMEATEAAEAVSFLHGSLMMELILFSLHPIAEGDLIPDTALCHELQYLSAEAVRQYAAMFGIDHTQLPWYLPPISDFQSFLLTGPVAKAEQLQFIKGKRDHFNVWI